MKRVNGHYLIGDENGPHRTVNRSLLAMLISAVAMCGPNVSRPVSSSKPKRVDLGVLHGLEHSKLGSKLDSETTVSSVAISRDIVRQTLGINIGKKKLTFVLYPSSGFSLLINIYIFD